MTTALTVKAHAGAVKAFRSMNISGEIAYKNDGYVYVLYDKRYSAFFLPSNRCQPWRANSTEDAEATERCTQFGIGMFSEPVYGSGDWSELVKQTVPESFLPRLTKEEQEDIKGLAVP